MAEESLPIQPDTDIALPQKRARFLTRVGKYSLVRLLELGVTLVIGMYLAVVVLNFGGYIDEIYRANIDDFFRFTPPPVMGMTTEEVTAWANEVRAAMEHAYGLDQPFLLRCLRWLGDALSFNMGDISGALALTDVNSTNLFRELLLGRLPYTLILFGVSNFLFFFASLFTALYLYRKFEGFWDRLVVFLSPISSIPSWVYGVFLVIIFAAILHWLPFPKRLNFSLGTYLRADFVLLLRYGWINLDAQTEAITLVEYMILPVAAIFLNLFFQSAYAWRTYFLLHSGEDYIELAKAKGLSNRLLERRYLLRPSLPYIITSLAMTLVGTWQSALILEKFFFWPGIGGLFFDSIGHFRVTGSIIVLFAYLLVITVFILDILYAFVDPRVRVGGKENAGEVARLRLPWRERIKSHFTPRPKVRLPRPKFVLPPLSAEQVSSQVRAEKLKRVSAWGMAVKEIRRYPSAIIGLVIISILVGVSIYTVVAIPYDKAITLWRGDESVWANNPSFAQPAWSNLFRRQKLPSTIVMNSEAGEGEKIVEQQAGDMRRIVITFPFDYSYDSFPQDLVVNIKADYEEKLPLVAIVWVTPDGREITLDTFTSKSTARYSFEYQNYFSLSSVLEHTSGPLPWESLFVGPGSDSTSATRGVYQLRVEAFVFEEGSDVAAEMVLYGQVHGIAGTDNARRDLSIAILWGTPFSLTFGLLGAVGTGLLAMVIAAVGVWFGGWADRLIQRMTEINMLLPALPIAIMIYFLYTHNIWVILGIIIILSVFGNAIKNYRAAFLQIKEAGYVQAALVYGAGNWRIIIRYLVPRIVPLLIPQLVALVPSYIFLEPTLAFIGIVDPFLPTWGKVLMTGLYVAEENNQIFYMTLMRNPYLALEPIGLMFVTGLAFSLLGMALDRIFNPRLRTM
jgi:peptide/nickel transport system permease protein